MSTTQAPSQQPRKEQIAYPRKEVPPRSSAPKVKQAPPSASAHGAGHYSGIQPEDRPYTTAETAAWKARAPQDDEVYEEAEIELQRKPSSARRYKTTAPQEDTSRQGTRIVPRRRGHSKAFYTFIVGGSIGIGVLLATVVPYFWQRGSDQLTYGYPRTYQTDVNVGHYPGNKDPRSHFIALNNHGYVEVIEIPEGVPGKAEDIHLYFVSLPANAAADQAPVTLSFEDMGGNHLLDMEVTCNNNTTIFYNDGHGFKGRS